MAANLFERVKGPPRTEAASSEEANKQSDKKHQLVERLLEWLMRTWTRDTVTIFQIRHDGPYPFRAPAPASLAANIAEELVKRGWLLRMKPRRRDSIEWRVAHRPAPQPSSRTKGNISSAHQEPA